MKQDLNAVRTAQDLERKYNLSSIAGLNRNYEIQKQGLTKVENELNDFVDATTKNFEELQNQVDGNITTWFYSGVPTLRNEPANQWNTDNDKNNHLGDLYYDKETGYSYRFAKQENEYVWIKLTDSDVTKALAIANSARDTADAKRRVFLVQPIPPYDNGDLWIKDKEIYICQIGKPIGEIFEEKDFINDLKYTDDTVANKVDGKLTILSGTVTEIIDNVDELKTTMTNTTKIVDKQGNEIGIIQQQQSKMQQTVNSFDVSISSIQKDISGLDGSLSNLEGNVTNLDNDLTKLENTVTTQSSKISQLEINQKGISQSVQSHTTKITNLESNVSNLDEEITATDNKANQALANQILTKEATGTQIHLTDSGEKDTELVKLYGRSTQKTRSGKNKLNIISITGNSNVNADFSYANDKVYIKGSVYDTSNLTSYRNGYFKISLETLSKIEGGQQYTISFDFELISKSIENATVGAIHENGSGSAGTFSLSTGRKIITYTSYADITNLEVRVSGAEGYCSNFMITTDGSSDYEAYGIMPSPDYPSEIEGYNLFDKKSATKDIIVSQGNGTFKPLIGYSHSDYIYVNCMQNLTMSGIGNTAMQCAWYDINKVFLFNHTNSSVREGTFEVPSDAYYLIFDFPNDNLNNIQLVKGISPKPYLPYQHIAVDVVGKNIFDGELELGTLTNNTGVVGGSNDSIRSKNFIPIESNQEYTISNDKGYCQYIYEYDINQNYIKFTNNTKDKYTFTTELNTKYIKFRTVAGNVENDLTTLFQLEKGSTATEYEPYKHNQYLVNLKGNKLCSLPNEIKDELIIENGRAKIIKKNGEFILDGSITPSFNGTVGDGETLVFQYSESILGINVPDISSDDTKLRMISTHFIPTSRNNYAIKYGCCIANSNRIFFNLTYNDLGITSGSTTAEKNNACKQWLMNNKPKFVYELAEPYEIDLGEVIQPATMQDISNITNSEDTDMYVKYYTNSTINADVMTKADGAIQLQEIIKKTSELEITDEQISTSVSEVREQTNSVATNLNNNYINNSELNQILDNQKQTITEEYTTKMTQDKESWLFEVINKLNTDGIEKLYNTLVKIDIDGLKLAKTNEDVVSLLNNAGLYVSDGELLEDLTNLLMKVDRAGAFFKMIEILGTIREQEIIQKEKITDSDYGECQAWYWIGE